MTGAPNSGQRLDKWLWCARIVKTRTGAARLIAGGKVRINSERVLKPSRLVRVGDVVTATNNGRLAVLRVIAAAVRRGPASEAATLYEDLTPKPAPDSDRSPPGERAGRRPTKRDRRLMEAFRAGRV